MSQIDYRKRLDDLLELNNRISTFYCIERFADILSKFLKAKLGRFTVTSDFAANIEVWSGFLDEDDDLRLRIYVGPATRFKSLRNRGVCAHTCSKIDFHVWPLIIYSMACRISHATLRVPLDDLPLLINYNHPAVESVVKKRLNEASENDEAIRTASLAEEASAIVIRGPGRKKCFTNVYSDPGYESNSMGFADHRLIGWSPIPDLIVHPRAAGGFYLLRASAACRLISIGCGVGATFPASYQQKNLSILPQLPANLAAPLLCKRIP
jgi:hypothetical protein